MGLNNPLSWTVRTCVLDIEALPLIPAERGDKKVTGDASAHAKPAPDRETTNLLLERTALAGVRETVIVTP